MTAPEAADVSRDGWRERARRRWKWFFPPEVPLPAEAESLLRTLYPTLRLDRLRFHLGLPHLVRLTGSEAITLPALLAARRVRIYFQPRAWSPGSIEGLGTLAHEAFHALQVQESAWGIGPFRPFLWLYFACGAANGFRYHGHSMERDAYELAGRGTSAFEAHLRHAHGEEPCAHFDPPRAALVAAPLARPSADLRFWLRLAGSTPWLGRRLRWEGEGGRAGAIFAAPFVALWLSLWIVAVLGVWLAILLIEGAGVVSAGIPRLLAGGSNPLGMEQDSVPSDQRQR